MTFHDRAGTNDINRLATTDSADALHGDRSVGQLDATKFQANSTEFAAARGSQTVDSNILPQVNFFDSMATSSPKLMAMAEGQEHHSVFGKLGEKAKDIGSKATDVAKKAGEKTGDLAKKGTGNDKPYSENNLEAQAEKAFGKHDQATRKAIHDTLAKMSDADKHKLYADLQKYNTNTELAKKGTTIGGIIGAGPLGGVVASQSKGEVGKVIPKPDSVKTFEKKVNEKLHH